MYDFGQIVSSGPVRLSSILQISFLSRMSCRQTIVKGKFPLMSMRFIEHFVERLRYFEFHLQVDLVVDVIVEILIVVEGVHLVDASFALT